MITYFNVDNCKWIHKISKVWHVGSRVLFNYQMKLHMHCQNIQKCKYCGLTVAPSSLQSSGSLKLSPGRKVCVFVCPDVTATLASQYQALKAIRGLGQGLMWGKEGRSAIAGPKESGTWGGDQSQRFIQKGQRSGVYTEWVGEPLLPTLQGIHQPARTGCKFNSAWLNMRNG